MIWIKPFKGNLYKWRKVSCDKWGYDVFLDSKPGYFFILGFTDEQMKKFGTVRMTSRVVNFDKETNRIETINSIYQLIGEEQ